MLSTIDLILHSSRNNKEKDHLRQDLNYRKKNVSRLFFTTFLIITILFLFFGYLHRGWVFGIDAEASYMMARSLYFDHDFDYRNELSLTPHPDMFEPLIIEHSGKDRFIFHFPFPLGYALLSQPFFFISNITTTASNSFFGTSLSADGYKGLFGFIVPFGTIIYGLIGIYFAYKLLREFYEPSMASLSVNVLLLSSSLLWYITGHVTMTHVHSFTVLTILIYLVMPLFKKDCQIISTARYAGIGLFSALAILMRLQNAIFLLIPIIGIFMNFYATRSTVLRQNVGLLIKIGVCILSFIIAFIPQLLYWKVYRGHWFVNPYSDLTDISFYPSQLHVFDTLFSTNHGLFLWNPITLISIIGIVLLFFRSKGYLLLLSILSLCFMLNLYIIASYFDFSMANSFGNRGFDGSTLFFAIGFAEILHRLWFNKIYVGILCAVLIVWNFQLLLQQRYFGWLPLSGGVTSYSDVFTNYKKLPEELKRIQIKYF